MDPRCFESSPVTRVAPSPVVPGMSPHIALLRFLIYPAIGRTLERRQPGERSLTQTAAQDTADLAPQRLRLPVPLLPASPITSRPHQLEDRLVTFAGRTRFTPRYAHPMKSQPINIKARPRTLRCGRPKPFSRGAEPRTGPRHSITRKPGLPVARCRRHDQLVATSSVRALAWRNRLPARPLR